MTPLPFLAVKDIVSAIWTSKFPKCERKKRGNEEIFQGCFLISYYMREYEETLKDYSGLFQLGIFPINVAIVAHHLHPTGPS